MSMPLVLTCKVALGFGRNGMYVEYFHFDAGIALLVPEAHPLTAPLLSPYSSGAECSSPGTGGFGSPAAQHALTREGNSAKARREGTREAAPDGQTGMVAPIRK